MSIHHNKNSEKTDPAKQRGENPKEETWGEYLERKADYYGRPVGEYDPNADISFSEDGETTEEKEIRFSLDGKPFAPMDTTNMRKPGPGEAPGREAVDIQPHTVFQPEEGKADAAATWKDQFYREGNNKYRIVATGGPKTGQGQKRVYSVLDNDAEFAAHEKDEVELDFSFELLMNLTEDSLKEMWKGKFAYVPDGHLPTTDELIDIRRRLIADTMPNGDTTAFDKTLIAGADSGATFTLLKQTGAWELYRLLDLTRRYHVFHQFLDESMYQEAEAKKRPVGKGHAALPANHLEYEKQVSANCYGCAGSKLINYLTGENLLDQYKVRNFVPRYLSRSEHNRLVGGKAQDYEEAKHGVEVYAGKGKTRNGNFFGISDVIFDKKANGGLGRKDIAVHQATYHLRSVKKDSVRHNLVEAMKTKLTSLIAGGTPAALLTNGHYVTVVGIDGDQITYLDSLPSKHKLGPIKEDFKTFLLGNVKAFDTVELTWAKSIDANAREALMNEYKGLGIDPETGEIIRTNKLHTDEDVAHRTGIAIKKSRREMDAEGNADISHYLTESVCLHRGAFMTEEQFAAWEERDAQAWEEAKKEQPERRDERRAQKKDQRSAGKKDKTVFEEDFIITATDEKNEEPVVSIPKEKEKEKDRELTPEERLQAYQIKAAAERQHMNKITTRRRRLRYGTKDEGIDPLQKDAYFNALRCMRFFDPKLSDQELGDRGLAMERKLRRPDKAVISKFELARNVRIMEGLMEQILSLDIKKEFAANDPKEMAELYYKYEPLFTFAAERETIKLAMFAIEDSGQVPGMLERFDVGTVDKRLEQIDAYGQYFASLAGNEEYKDAEAPDLTKAKVTDEDCRRIAEEIHKRWEGFDERVAPLVKQQDADAACRAQELRLMDGIKTARRGEEQDAARPLDEGLALTVMKAAAQIGDDDAQSAETYQSLSRGADAQDPAQCARYCNAAERVFAAVLSFDPASLPKEDLLLLSLDEKAYRAFYHVADISLQVPALIMTYRSAAAEGKALTEAQLAAIESRCASLAAMKLLLDGRVEEAKETVLSKGQKQEEGKGVNEAYQALLKKTNEEEPGVIKAAADAIVLKSAEAEQARRQSAKEAFTGRLAEGNSIFLPIVAADQRLDGFANQFKHRKKYTQTRREKEMKTAGTELFEKNRLARQLTDGANATKDAMAKNRRAISFNVRAGLSTEKFAALSAFFTEDMEENLLLTRRLSGKGSRIGADQSTGEKAEAKKFAFRLLADKFLEVKVDGIDLSSDGKLAENAAKLEDITQKVCAMRTLMESDPTFIRTLSDEILSAPDAKVQESLYDRVMKQMDRLGRLSDHYRIRKLIMTDSYYLSHYNDEIGLSVEKHESRERKMLSNLLRKSRSTAVIVEKTLTGEIEEGDEAVRTPQWLHDGIAALIDVYEEEHRKRAYADGKMDLSLISKDTLQTLMRDIHSLKEAYPAFSVGKNEEEAIAISKAYSPQLQQMVKQMCVVNNQSAQIGHANSMMPGLHDRMRALIRQFGDNNRIAEKDVALKFDDPATGEHYEYASELSRDLDAIVMAGAGQMMSQEEILELFECINAAKWKDIDYSDPVQAAAAKELYLSSMAKLFQLYINEQYRLENTYGFLPAQLSTAALTLAIGDNNEAVIRYGKSNTATDAIGGVTTVIDGQEMSFVDALVVKGYLSKNYVEKGKQLSKQENGLSARVNFLPTAYSDYFSPFEESEKAPIESINLPEYADSINEYRRTAKGPMMSEKEEFKGWALSAGAAAAAGMPEQDKILQESGIRYMRDHDRYTRSMVQLNRFINSLAGVETGGHSKEYKHFDACLKELWECYSQIEYREPADGKRLDPDGMIELRKAYFTTIRASKDYLKNKNLNHRNPIYRRRYAIVGELLSVMEKDYQALGEKNAYTRYRLEDATEEGRQTLVTAASKDITAMGSYLSRRNVFTAEIDGKKKRMAFTEQATLAQLLKDKPQEEVKAQTEYYQQYGIPVTANIDKRKVAMSILAKEIGTEERIEKSILAKISIEDEEGKKQDKSGTLTEFVDGMNIYEVRAGLQAGDIVADNESALLEQLSDIQITDYICANVDRSCDKMSFVMEDTGKVNEATQKPILRIKRIVGIDCNVAFGNRTAQSFKEHTLHMSIPETMQVISRRTANRILELKKERLFLLLGTTVTEEEKDAMWTRVEHMQLAIKDASDKTTQNGLSIVDSFEKYTLKEISGANLEPGNIFRVFDYETDCLGKKDEPVNEKKIPHRLNTREVRLDIVPFTERVKDQNGTEMATMHAIDLYYNQMQLPPAQLRAQLGNPQQLSDYLNKCYGAAQEFNRTVAGLFDHVSTDKEYGIGGMHNELMDLFSHKDNGILDIFFIDGKAARELFPQINSIVDLLMADPATFEAIAGTPAFGKDEMRVEVTKEHKHTARDILAKAFIMSYIVSGTKQVTIANYQENKYGVEEFAITDLNVIIRAPQEFPLVPRKLAGADTKLIEKSRKTRDARFKKIHEQYDKRMAVKSIRPI